MVTPLHHRRYRIVWRAPAPIEDHPDGASPEPVDEDRLLAVELADGADPASRDHLAGELLRVARAEHPDLVRIPELETAAVPGLAAGALVFAAEGIDGGSADRIVAALAARGIPPGRASLLCPVDDVQPGDAALAADPDRVAAVPDRFIAGDPPRGSLRPAQLRRMLALGRRLHAERRLEPLVDQIIDAAVELTAAERGFLLLHPPGQRDRLAPAAPGDDVDVDVDVDVDAADDSLRAVHAIAERAARTGRIQRVADASATDDSAIAARRSILAVPLRCGGRAIGVLCVDHHFRPDAFDDEAVELAGELAAIAAVAIDNARRAGDERRQIEETAELHRHATAQLAAREAELADRIARVPSDGAVGAGHRLVGRSAVMVDLVRTIDRVADVSLPILITGERGTGKELVARAIHDRGARRAAAFVALRGGDLPAPLVEAELFGHAAGAFPGAERDRRGLVEIAHGGTLFVDEIGDLHPAAQAGLVRVLEDGAMRRIGDGEPRRVDVRVVVASSRSLDDLVGSGRLREDLHQRLSALRLRVPPLRERASDIPELVDHFLARLAGADPRRPITRAALSRLCTYSWPGNVRELENELIRATALAEGAIEVADLSPPLAAAVPPRPPRGRELLLRPHVEALERSLVEEALRRTAGNQTAAARLLGLSRFGLQKKLRRFGLIPTPD